MTRAEALLKLLALGPLNREEIHEVTAWPYVDVHSTIAALTAVGDVVHSMRAGRRVFHLPPSARSPFARPSARDAEPALVPEPTLAAALVCRHSKRLDTKLIPVLAFNFYTKEAP